MKMKDGLVVMALSLDLGDLGKFSSILISKGHLQQQTMQILHLVLLLSSYTILVQTSGLAKDHMKL